MRVFVVKTGQEANEQEAVFTFQYRYSFDCT